MLRLHSRPFNPGKGGGRIIYMADPECIEASTECAASWEGDKKINMELPSIIWDFSLHARIQHTDSPEKRGKISGPGLRLRRDEALETHEARRLPGPPRSHG